jgi:hypothetical protein
MFGVMKDHDNTKCDMDRFAACIFYNLEWLSLFGSNIDDKGWRKLVEKASNFPKLKILGLSNIRSNKRKQQHNSAKVRRLIGIQAVKVDRIRNCK